MKKTAKRLFNPTAIVTVLASAAMVAACSDGLINWPGGGYGQMYDLNSSGGGGGTSRGGSMARFTITGDWLYTVNDSQLSVVSIANPERPAEGDRITIGGNIETIFPMDTLLFIGSQNGMFIYNIAKPEFPQHLSTSLHFRSCDPVVAADTLAFVTLNSSMGAWCGSGGNVLNVYNIKDLRSPVMIGSVSMTSPRGLAVDPGRKMLFVCDDGIKAYDIADPRTPEPLYSSLATPEVGKIEAYDCIVTGDGRLLVIGADGLYQLSYDATAFALISKIDIRREQ